jgi:DNA-binding SARP family transcriptional activator
MSIRNLVILSQVNPPGQRSKVLVRERLNRLIGQAKNFPLTILEAGTGYGKSTAILSFLKATPFPAYWYTITGTDRDPQLFLAKLFTAFSQHGKKMGEEALHILEMPDGTQNEALIALVNALTKSLEKDTFLILDDFHRVFDVPEVVNYMDWIIENIPHHLHVIIASRFSLDFPSINKWRIKGGLLEIKKEQLAFTSEEIVQLFDREYDIKLSEVDTERLFDKTEGWIIGLQLIWQTLRNNPGMKMASVLEDGRLSRTALFDYLAEEVLNNLESEIQEFLLKTSILSKLDSNTCDFLLNAEHSDEILAYIHNTGLFLEELRPGVYRYHQMFREFLLSRFQRDVGQTKEFHRKAASYFQAHEYWEETIYHLLSSDDYEQVNRILENIGTKLIQQGRQESIHYWIHEIPGQIRKNYPYLQFLLGEVNRYQDRFDGALEYYHTAERLFRQQKLTTGISIALKGQAQVYLDTIRPNNADQLLQDALKLLDPAEHQGEVADLLVLTAENQLNLGFPESAEALLNQAKILRPELDMETDYIQARIFLRTGRFKEGIQLIKERDIGNPKLAQSRPQRFHRESTLLLSLFYAFIGEIDLAEKYARQGIEIGELLQSTFVQSVGYMRLGHALLLQSQHPFRSDYFQKAMNYFEESIEKVDVTRIHVEPLWGMCRALGYSGKIDEAEDLAKESLEIAQKAGDEWIGVLIQLSIGAGAVLTGNYGLAQQYLTSAEAVSLRLGDPFILCVARLWLAIKVWRQGFINTAFGYLEKILPVLVEKGYEFLFTEESLMGLKDPESVLPLLFSAYQNNIQPESIKGILKPRNIEISVYHPGYSLWVKTLGNFSVWRGEETIDPQDWRREKALQLFQILIANRDRWLHRDTVINMLWADSDLEKAQNYYKVVLNTLNSVLEPDRSSGQNPFFIERRQDNYRINPKARIVVDTDLYLEYIKKGSQQTLENAINLYEGRYFENCYVQEWLVVEQEYFHQKFLLAADQLISIYLSKSEYEKALNMTYVILNKDNLWESAYRSQMIIFDAMKRPSMIREVFQQCQEVFRSQIDSPLSPETIKLFERLMAH